MGADVGGASGLSQSCIFLRFLTSVNLEFIEL